MKFRLRNQFKSLLNLRHSYRSFSSDEVQIVDAPKRGIKKSKRPKKKTRQQPSDSEEVKSINSCSENDDTCVNITRQQAVREILRLNEIPPGGWIIEDDVAYLLDLNHLADKDFGFNAKGEVLSIGAYIRAEVNSNLFTILRF